VDVTQYAPESERYPSAAAALAAAVGNSKLPRNKGRYNSNNGSSDEGSSDEKSSSSSSSSSLSSSTNTTNSSSSTVGSSNSSGGAAAVNQQHTQPRFLPVAVVGGNVGGACAPTNENYRRFFAAAACAWEVEVRGAGHNVICDEGSAALQRTLCPPSDGTVSDSSVRTLYQGVLLALCESVMRPGGADVLSLLQRRCDNRDGGGGSFTGIGGSITAAAASAVAAAAAAAGGAGPGPKGQPAAGQQQLPTWATERQPPPVYLPPGPLPRPTLQPQQAGAALRSRLERSISALQYQTLVQHGGLLELSVRFKGFGSS